MRSLLTRLPRFSTTIYRAKPSKLGNFSKSSSGLATPIKSLSIAWPDALAIYKRLWSRIAPDEIEIEEEEWEEE